MYHCSLERMSDKIHTFSKFGDAGHGGITRYALSEEDKMARAEWVKRMTAIGATIEMDDLANMYATIPGSDPNAKRIVMGSHCDSVKNGGNYDGILGVMSAMEVLETVVAENIPHKHPLTAMIFTNEEGSEFPPCMMCSGTMAHDYMPERFRDNFAYDKMMASHSILETEVTFGEKLAKFPYRGEKANRMSPDKYVALFETHIEQGPILEDAKKDVGVVTCVLGQMLYRVKFYGFAAHAGTFPMKKRHDAFYAASQALCYLHEEIDKLGYEDLVYTTGEVVIHPCVNTVIPDFFDFSIDVRHEDPRGPEQGPRHPEDPRGARVERLQVRGRPGLEPRHRVLEQDLGGLCPRGRGGAGLQPHGHQLRCWPRCPVHLLHDPHHHDLRSLREGPVPLRARAHQRRALHQGCFRHAQRRPQAGREGHVTFPSSAPGTGRLSTSSLSLVRKIHPLFPLCVRMKGACITPCLWIP